MKLIIILESNEQEERERGNKRLSKYECVGFVLIIGL